MSLNTKFRACIITAILMVSSLSIFVISPKSVNAEDDDSSYYLGEDVLISSGMHPFATAGFFEYTETEPMKINGNVVFNLYFASTLASQLNYKDELEVILYNGMFKKLGDATITLEPELFGDTVQSCTVKLENIEYNVTYEETLIFAVKIKQSDKPLGNIIERRYEEKLKARAIKVAEWLNKSSNEDLNQIGSVIVEILGTADEFGITSEEIGNLADSLSSSSFVFGSPEYPSSVVLSTDSHENLTLYFNSSSFEDIGALGSLAEMTNETPNGTAVTWPSKLLDVTGGGVNEEGWLLWFTLWLEYIMGGQTPNEEDTNVLTYYLKGDNTFTMEEPSADSASRVKISSETKWEGISFDRNRIITNVTGDLFIYYPAILFLRKVRVNATLYDEDEKIAIASQEKQLDRTTILELILRGPDSPTVFTFDDAVGKELINGHRISLILKSIGEPILSLKSTILLCDSSNYLSSLTFNLQETKNIQIGLESEEKQKIIVGGSAEYILNISSEYNDNVNIEINSTDLSDKWDITYPEALELSEGNTIVHIFINHTDETVDAYGDNFDGTIIITGKTGRAEQKISVDVSDDAVEYDIDVIAPEGKEIKHGSSDTYNFIITNANTGLWPDSYKIEAYSEHNWSIELEYDQNSAKNVDVGQEFEVNVTVYIPEDTDVCADLLTLKITSKEGNKHSKEKIVFINVTTAVVSPNIFESLYDFFESTATSLGLDSVLGDYGAWFLIFITAFLILIFMAIILLIIRKKYVDIICLERIKEINPDEHAEFDITIQNPHKEKLTYEISTKTNSTSDRWETSIDTNNISLEPKEAKPVKLTVKPTDYVKSEDWAEVKIIVKAVEKQKTASISTIAVIKDAKPELEIFGVLHWPKTFKKGDLVKTTFRLVNRGKVSADKVSVVLFINGEEKNKVEDITIPRGGYADVEIPWIAVKGKNEVNIVVN